MSIAALKRYYNKDIRPGLRKEVTKQSRNSKEFHVDLSTAALTISGLSSDQIKDIQKEAARYEEWDSTDQKLKFHNKFALDRAVGNIFKDLAKQSERQKAAQTGNTPSPSDYRLTKGSNKRQPKLPSVRTTVTVRNKYSISEQSATSLLSVSIPDFGLTEKQQDAVVQAVVRGVSKDTEISGRVLKFLVDKFVVGKSNTQRNASKYSINEASAVAAKYISTQTVAKPKILDKEGQFSSANTILQEIKKRSGGSLHNQIASNMGLPRLRYRTGRLAKSVKLTRAAQVGNNIDIYYKWHGYPYSLFERPSYRYYTEARRPDALIDLSVRQLAVGLVSDKFNLRILKDI